jgi:hypothetical protein
MSFTGDRKRRVRGTAGSSPIAREMDSISENLEVASTDSNNATPTKLNTTQPAQQSSTPNTASPATTSRFSFLTSSVSALKGLKSPPAPQPYQDDDGLINLDIKAALFPTGSVCDRNSFSPAAFKNLEMTAVGLLNKFQTAYRQQTIELQMMRAEQDAQTDEKEGADMRMKHLKIQLEGMAQKAEEQQAVMRELMEELSREKKLRMQERLARDKASTSSETLTVSEDLDAEEDQQKRKWRKSDGTLRSDISIDTDEESFDEASVFSRSRSPTIATTVSEVSHSPLDPSTPQLKPTTAALAPPPLPAPRTTKQAAPQITTFQRLFKGGGSSSSSNAQASENGTSSCRNCQGQDASVAWDTAGLLRDENRGLKDRVGELEAAIEGALDVVHGLAAL